MPKCPSCGKSIECLTNYQKGEQAYDFRLDSKGDPNYTFDSFVDGYEQHFECPECEEVLFHSEEDAVRFLEGE